MHFSCGKLNFPTPHNEWVWVETRAHTLRWSKVWPNWYANRLTSNCGVRATIPATHKIQLKNQSHRYWIYQAVTNDVYSIAQLASGCCPIAGSICSSNHRNGCGFDERGFGAHTPIDILLYVTHWKGRMHEHVNVWAMWICVADIGAYGGSEKFWSTAVLTLACACRNQLVLSFAHKRIAVPLLSTFGRILQFRSFSSNFCVHTEI